jgi:cell wall-associated NlpC family hydrolase
LNTSQGRQTITAKRAVTKEDSIHIVRKGETLYRIARQNGLSIDELKELNGLKNNKIKIGQGQEEILSEREEVLSSARPDGQTEVREFEVRSKEESSYNQLSEDPVFEAQDKGVISQILSYSKDLLGVPYRFGGTTLRALDCSAFVQKVFKSIGIDLPRTAREQFKTGRDVDRNEISEGDLLFFKTRSHRYPSHVGIYIGDNQFIHASRSERRVSIDSLDEPYYKRRFIGAKRLIEAEVTAEPSNKDKSG